MKDVENSILDMCRQLVSMIHVSSKATERLLGLSAAQLFVLKKMSDGQVRSINELAALTHTHQSSVSVVVKKLIERELLRGQPSKEDGRRLDLRLTAAGGRILKDSPEPIQEQLIRGIKSMKADEAKELELLLKKMLSEVQDSDKPARLFFEDET